MIAADEKLNQSVNYQRNIQRNRKKKKKKKVQKQFRKKKEEIQNTGPNLCEIEDVEELMNIINNDKPSSK